LFGDFYIFYKKQGRESRERYIEYISCATRMANVDGEESGKHYLKLFFLFKKILEMEVVLGGKKRNKSSSCNIQ
jgi:hypothetical protein